MFFEGGNIAKITGVWMYVYLSFEVLEREKEREREK